MMEAYRKAKKSGRRNRQSGRSLLALDEEEPHVDALQKMYLGIIEIPLGMVIGTKTKTRGLSFTADFMPAADENSEFAMKWIRLFEAQLEYGIREPVRVFEYKRRYYVQEGNKRVSVMKYLNMPTIPARVIRVLPAAAKANALYYEYYKFTAVAPVYELVFSKPEHYQQFAHALHRDLNRNWPGEEVKNIRYSFYRFLQANHRGSLEDISDAYFTFIQVFSIKELEHDSIGTIRKKAQAIKAEWRTIKKADNITLVETSDVHRQKSLLRTWIKPAEYSLSKPLKVAFVYDKAVETSNWIYAHEAGRIDMENQFAGRVSTYKFENISNSKKFADAIQVIDEQHVQMVFTASPTLMADAVKASIRCPHIHFLNCSIHLPSSRVRTYYAKMYEAKFLMGMIAAGMAANHRIGYESKYPF